MTLKEVYASAKQHGRTDIVKFMEDMKRVGLKMRFYQGPFHWSGPAVVVSDLQEVLAATRVNCQWDNLGLDYIVYPRESL